ncbi:MAG: error-prone DNA polymerase [Xanthomonadales bacterium]|jgi:error-prone DNA polymerase|nr:error-prone DNA polymerase [Xanthomonadales bacterium]
MNTPPPYAELVCSSNFTFLTGASHPQELVACAAERGYSAIAITDECSMAGVVRALEEARRCAERGTPIQLIPGSSFRLGNGSRLILLPRDHTGYAQICTLITKGRRDAPKGEYELPDACFENGLDHCLAIWLPEDRGYKWGQSKNSKQAHRDTNLASANLYSDPIYTASWLTAYFPNRCWLGLARHLGPDDPLRVNRLLAAAHTAGLPVTACGDVQMHARSRRMLHDVLAAVRHGCPVSALGYRAQPSGERHLRSRSCLAQLFNQEQMEESVEIARRCSFRLDQLNYQYPREVVPQGKTASQYLRELVEAGIRERWENRGQSKGTGQAAPSLYSDPGSVDPIPSQLRQQIEKELGLIRELHYEPYFLTVYDIVRFARSQGILCQGRGSAANSAVCYCLGITEVDPARMNMLFERFISRERDEPPDIDVDFEHERREEVIQYIYHKYGRDRAALAATVITYRPKSAIRDVSKALGFSLGQADQLARNTAWWDKPEGFEQRIRQQGFQLDNLKVRQLVHLVQLIIGFPRHLSQHVGGFVISEAPLASLVPVENAAMANRTVIQWDKEDLETLGLLKVDCLALGMLSAIHRCLDLVNKNRGQSKNLKQAHRDANLVSANFYSDPLSLADIPPEDPETYAMIQKADTIGVFQVESRAQMAMLPRLKPACFYDLVIEVAIVRPGPIQGNMVHPYLQRRRGLEQVEYPSQDLKAVLERTLGVPIFQEQVMQIAMVAAGFSGSEADLLRRSMAAWSRRGGMEHMHRRLVDGMLERGYGEDFAERIYRQIQGFGDYGFPESHAASFALLVYVSAWLKRHHPAAFTCALLNSQPMGFYQPAQLVQDAQRHGVKVLPADVRYSDWDCALENGGSGFSRDPEPKSRLKPLPQQEKHALRLGLRQVKGMRQASANRIAEARQQGPFHNLQDLTHRANLDRHDLAVLAEAAALRGLTGHRHRARWEVAAVEKPVDDLLTPSSGSGFSRDPEPKSRLKPLPQNQDSVTIRPPSREDDMRADYASTGLTLGPHPVSLLRSVLRRRRAITARELHQKPHGARVRACGLITMRQRPMTASGTLFLTLEDETGCVNIVIWPHLFEKQRAEILGASLLAVDGVLETDGDVHHLIAQRVFDFSELAGSLQSRSRNFC